MGVIKGDGGSPIDPRVAEIDRLRAELASRQIDVDTFREGNQKLRAELAEARRALLASNDTVLANKKLQEDNAAKDARIAELESGAAEYAYELARTEIALAIARAERAEAERDAMREMLKSTGAHLAKFVNGDDTDDNGELIQEVMDAARSQVIAVRAALAPSPAGPDRYVEDDVERLFEGIDPSSAGREG